MRSERVIHERCAGGKCPLKESCRMWLIPRDDSRFTTLIKPVYDASGNASCVHYKKSTVDQVKAEIKELKLTSLQ